MPATGRNLTTGQVAQRLGTSRQHVVDLCERGELSFIRVGAHRRVPESEVDRVLSRPRLDRDAARSLWLHRVVVSHLMTEPERVMQLADETLDRRMLKAEYNGSPRPYYQRWKQVLGSGVEKTAEVLTEVTEESNVLRSCSPFVGVITQEERRKTLDAFSRYWDGTQEVG